MKRFLVDPAAAGDRYSPVVVPPEAIARRASSPRVLSAVRALTAGLADDPYTRYVSEFYAAGVEVCGPEWGFMDIVTVLYAVSEMGRPENYLEIGVRRGRSVCAVAAASPGTDVYAFDLWQPGYANSPNPGPELARAELRRVGHRGRVEFVDGDSHRTVPAFFAGHPGLSFDLITVDGDHSPRGAWEDLRTVVPRLRVGGVLVFDDTSNPYCPGLDRVWRELLAADPGLAGFSFGGLGAGVSFAVRQRPSPAGGVRKPRFWQSPRWQRA